MSMRSMWTFGVMVLLIGGSGALCAEPSAAAREDDTRVSVETARDRAKLMHRIYSATLDVMHHHYFDVNKAVLPARAMEDVFDELARQSNIKARWIAVNTKAMSVPHEPKSDFEREAAQAIASGKESFERVEGGVYHRAGVIPLTAGCINCHANAFANPPKTPRYAGLVISVPLAP